MNISEVIKRCQAALTEHGDLPFVVMTEIDQQFLIIEDDRPIDLIEVDFRGGVGVVVMAVMPNEDLENNEDQNKLHLVGNEIEKFK